MAQDTGRRKRNAGLYDASSLEFDIEEYFGQAELPRNFDEIRDSRHRKKRQTESDIETQCFDGSVLVDGQCSKLNRYISVKIILTCGLTAPPTHVINNIKTLTLSPPAECAVGSFASGGQCVACPKGTYQTRAGQLSCLSCQSGTSTIAAGSDSTGDCVGAYTILFVAFKFPFFDFL